jgi:hypothetical protein
LRRQRTARVRRGGRRRLGRSRSRGWSGSGGTSGAIDHGDDGLDRNGLTFGNLDFFEHASGRRRNFRVDFIGGDFKERLVAFDLVAGLFQPFGDGAFKDAFAHLGHDHIDCHESVLLAGLWLRREPRNLSSLPPNAEGREGSERKVIVVRHNS